MTIGTKSVLFGAHCFFLHPFFVAWAWYRLFGFPWDPRLWVAFFTHDLGYIGKPNLDGPEGEEHPLLGARIMTLWFDPDPEIDWEAIRWSGKRHVFVHGEPFGKWGQFCLLHSRYYVKRLGLPFSRLCVADKLAFTLTPRWLYLPMVNATGEIHEYLQNAKQHLNVADYRTQADWHADLCQYMRGWVAAHKDGAVDTWTSADRHARNDSGVWS